MACPPAVSRERRDTGRTPQKCLLSLTLPARQLSAAAWRASRKRGSAAAAGDNLTEPIRAADPIDRASHPVNKVAGEDGHGCG
jgi:hypothetical protein